MPPQGGIFIGEKMNKKILLLLMLCSVKPALAIQIDDLSMFMDPVSNVVGQRISNPSSTAHLVTISVEAIDSPYSMKPLPVAEQQRGEVRFTPERVLMPAGASNFVKFYYHGKSDSKERYYRVTWLDNPLSENSENSSNKAVAMHAMAAVGTVLVVQPRAAHLAYQYHGGKLINTGNTSFRMVAYGPCKDKHSKQKVCYANSPIAPHISFAFRNIDMSSNDTHIGVWEKGRLVPVDISPKV